MIPLITITGTESTGKTELAEKLAAHYKTVFIPDYSRLYIEQMNRQYNELDVIQIAKGLIEEENKMIRSAHPILFSDNDLINIKIWLQYYKWHVPDWLEEEIVKRKNNLHLLCDIDIEWIADEQRKNENGRIELFELFQHELGFVKANYKIISGKNDTRTEKAIQAIDQFLLLLK